MVFTMLFEKRSKICPLPKNDDVLAGKKSQSGGGGMGVERPAAPAQLMRRGPQRQRAPPRGF